MMDIRTDRPASPWQDYLAALPATSPPAALRERILSAWTGRMQRSSQRWSGAALAAALVLALVGAVLWTHESGPVDGPGPGVTEVVADPMPGDGRLAQLDDAIARAYASNVSEAELQALWQARASLLVQQRPAHSALLVQL